MRSIKFISIGVALLILCGCVRSVCPLYTEDNLIFDPALLGTWSTKNRNIVWTFQQSQKNIYDLTIFMKGGGEGKLEARLLRLGDFLFLDFFPINSTEKQKSYGRYFIPVHTFARIIINKNTLVVSEISEVILEHMIKNNKINIPYARVNGYIVLTATTKELQSFVTKYAEDKSLFSSIYEFHRRNSGERNSQDSGVSPR